MSAIATAQIVSRALLLLCLCSAFWCVRCAFDG